MDRRPYEADSVTQDNPEVSFVIRVQLITDISPMIQSTLSSIRSYLRKRDKASKKGVAVLVRYVYADIHDACNIVLAVPPILPPLGERTSPWSDMRNVDISIR